MAKISAPKIIVMILTIILVCKILSGPVILAATTPSIVVEVKGVNMLSIIVYCTISGFSDINEKGALIREKGTSNWTTVNSASTFNPYTISFYNLKPNTTYEIKGYCLYGTRNNLYVSPTVILQRTLVSPKTEIKSINPETTSANFLIGLDPTIYNFMHGGFDLYLVSGNQYIKRCWVKTNVILYQTLVYTLGSLEAATDYKIKPFAVNHFGEVAYFEDVSFTTDSFILPVPSIRPITVVPLPKPSPTPTAVPATPTPMPTAPPSPTPTVTPSPTPTVPPSPTPAVTSDPTAPSTVPELSETAGSSSTSAASQTSGETSSKEITVSAEATPSGSQVESTASESPDAISLGGSDGNNQILIIVLAAIIAGLAATVVLLIIRAKKK